MKIELGKLYRTLDGLEVRIYATDGGEDYPIHGAIKFDNGWFEQTWTSDGRYVCGETKPSDADLIEVKPRIKRTVWLNIHPPASYIVHDSKHNADKNAFFGRIACVKIEIDCEEGEGL